MMFGCFFSFSILRRRRGGDEIGCTQDIHRVFLRVFLLPPRNLWSCIRLNDEYQEYYRHTKETLLTLPKGGTSQVSRQLTPTGRITLKDL